MQNILTTSASSLIPPCHIGRPQPAFGPGEAPPAVDPPAVQPVTNFPDIGEVTGDQKPDWGDFDKKYGEGGDHQQAQPPDRQPDQIPAAPDPAKGETQKPQKPPETAPTGPTGPKVDETGRARRADGTFAPSGATGPSGVVPKPAGASGPSGPAPFDPEAALKKLDAIQPKPNASEKTLNGFKEIKEITRAAIGRNKELSAKIAELEKGPKSDPQVEAELAELREFKATFEAQSDPKIAEEFKKTLDSAEDKIIEVLTTDEDLMMPADQAARLKAIGFDSPQGRNMINGILNAIAKTGDQLLLDRVKDMFRNRKAVVEGHEQKLAEIQEKAGKYWEGQQQREEEERKSWAGESDKKLISLFDQPGYEWGHYKSITADMDEAAKLEAEKHNTHLRDVIVPEIRKGIQAVWSRDPAAMEYIAKAHAVDHAHRQVASMQAELDQAKQRIAELEDTARGVQRISDPTREESAPVDGTKIPNSNLNVTAEEAADAYLENKYGRRA